MPKTWTNFEDVRLVFDAKANTVRLSARDHRLGGRAFVMQMSPGTRADELAREVLRESGVDVPIDLTISHIEEHKASPRPLSKNSNWVLLGDLNKEDFISNVVWNVDPRLTTEKNYPTTLAVIGKSGTGKTTLMQHITAHAVRFPDKFDVYVLDEDGTLKTIGGKAFGFSDMHPWPLIEPNKRRFFIVDSNVIPPNALESMLRMARAHGDIIAFSALEENSTGLLNFANKVACVGPTNLRTRILLGIEKHGVGYTGSGVLTLGPASGEIGSPNSSSPSHKFSLFAPEKR